MSKKVELRRSVIGLVILAVLVVGFILWNYGIRTDIKQDVPQVSSISHYSDSYRYEAEFAYNDNGDIEKYVYYEVEGNGDKTAVNDVDYIYDGNGRLIKVQPNPWPLPGMLEPKTEYTYDSNGRLIAYSELEGSKGEYNLEYDEQGRLIGKTCDTDFGVYKTSYGYNAAGQMILETEVVYDESGTTCAEWSYEYEYDSEGRKSAVVCHDGSDTSRTEYSYDYLPFVVATTDSDEESCVLYLKDPMGGDVLIQYLTSPRFVTNADGLLVRVEENASVFEISYYGQSSDGEEPEIPDTPEAPTEPEVSAYDLYAEVLKAFMDDCGYSEMEAYQKEYCQGLLYDIDGDGLEELALQVYDSSRFCNLDYQVWTIADGKAVCLLEEAPEGHAFGASVLILDYQGKRYFVYNELEAGIGGVEYTVLYDVSQVPWTTAITLYWDDYGYCSINGVESEWKDIGEIEDQFENKLTLLSDAPNNSKGISYESLLVTLGGSFH